MRWGSLFSDCLFTVLQALMDRIFVNLVICNACGVCCRKGKGKDRDAKEVFHGEILYRAYPQ